MTSREAEPASGHESQHRSSHLESRAVGRLCDTRDGSSRSQSPSVHRRSQKRDRSARSRGRSVRRRSHRRDRSARSRSPSAHRSSENQGAALHAGSASNSMNEFVKTLSLNFKLGSQMSALVTKCDVDTSWLDHDEEALAIVESGKLMFEALAQRFKKLKDVNELLTNLGVHTSRWQPKPEQEQCILGLRKENAELCEAIRTLEAGVKTVVHVLECKRYKHLYDTAHRHMCEHKQLNDDHQGRHTDATCNSTGRTLLAKDVARYNRNQPHRVNGGECIVSETSRLKVYSDGPDPSWVAFLTWKHTDADAVNRGMNAELKKTLVDTDAALNSNVDNTDDKD